MRGGAGIIAVSGPGTDSYPGVHSSATGMAASDPYPRSDRLPPGAVDCLTALALRERLEEEISRAERHGTALSCLLVVIDNLDEIAREHGGELREQALAYVAGALRRELRRFDRIGRSAADSPEGPDGPGASASAGDLLMILPGADSPRAEIVARRTLERLRTIKVEAGGTRWPLQVSVGLAAWRADMSAHELLAHARAAVGGSEAENGSPAHEQATAPSAQPPAPAQARAPGEHPPALGRSGRS